MSTPRRDWLNVAEASERLGISPRAVQKRCHNGKLTARRLDTPQGIKWEIDPHAVDANELANRTRPGEPTGRELTEPNVSQGNESTAIHSQNHANLDASPDANEPNLGREPDASSHANDPGRVAELKEEVQFLRSLLEARDRDAAELRAALREALRLAPKQLISGVPEDAQSAPSTQAKQTTPAPATTPQPIAQRESDGRKIRPLTRVLARLIGVRLKEVER